MYNAETDEFELEKDQPLNLILGNFASQGILHFLQASSRQYKIKKFSSSVRNWESICEYFKEFSVQTCLIKLNSDAILKIASDEYANVAKCLFDEVAQVPHIVFIYEPFIDEDCDVDYVYDDVNPNDLEKAMSVLEASNLEVIPYKRSAEVTMIADTFLRDTEQNLILRVYIPNDRYLAEESGRFLSLYREYLDKVEKAGVRHTTQNTSRGVIHELFGDDSAMAHKEEFSEFLDLCLHDKEKAEQVLKVKNVGEQQIEEIIYRYAKEAKRLAVDLKHQRERAILGIRQELEVDLAEEDITLEQIEILVDNLISRTLPFPTLSHRVAPHGRVTLNVNSNVVENLNGVVAKHINGSVQTGDTARELLELISIHGGSKTVDLQNAVHTLEDEELSVVEKKKSLQRIKGFLASMKTKGVDIASKVAQKYIESQIGL